MQALLKEKSLMNAASISSSRFVVALLLAAVMAATRWHHFGSVFSLPDASLAVFFLAGIYLRSPLFLAGFLAEAALIDYLAITVGGVSDFCISSAYVFLIPAYAAPWFAGRWYAARHRLAWSTLLPLGGGLLLSVGVAYLISEGSFYLLSGRFPEVSAAEYFAQAVRHFPAYALHTALYVLLAAGVHGVGAAASRARPAPSARRPYTPAACGP